MIKKKFKLKRKKDFQKVFSEGLLFQNRFFILRVLPNHKKNNRYGVVVSSKVSKKAVERNKIKRAVWSLIKTVDLKKGFDFVIIAKKTVLDLNSSEIRKKIYGLFKKGFYIE